LVYVSGFAVARDRPDRQAIRRASSWARDYLRRAALADLGCAIVGVFAAQLRFCRNVTGTCIALSLAVRTLLRLTGFWQVSVRSDVSQEESARLDLSYAKSWSLSRRPADFRRRRPHPHHESDTAQLLA
jgi:hypothetical protein